MGFPKALLEWQGKSFLETIIDSLRRARVSQIRVVTSAPVDRLIRQELSLPGIEIVINPDPARGQLSSLQCGLRGFPVDIALICLVDHPRVSTDLIFNIKEAVLGTQSAVVIPRFGNKRGHPIALRNEVMEAMIAAPAHSTPKEVLLQYWSRVLELDTEDAGILADIDTPSDYEQHLHLKFPRR
jgi:CTP:molybdopterin cytidylyltransferase MocA